MFGWKKWKLEATQLEARLLDPDLDNQTRRQTKNWGNITTVVGVKICTYLPIMKIVAITRTCKNWHHFSTDIHLWVYFPDTIQKQKSDHFRYIESIYKQCPRSKLHSKLNRTFSDQLVQIKESHIKAGKKEYLQLMNNLLLTAEELKREEARRRTSHRRRRIKPRPISLCLFLGYCMASAAMIVYASFKIKQTTHAEEHLVVVSANCSVKYFTSSYVQADADGHPGMIANCVATIIVHSRSSTEKTEQSFCKLINYQGRDFTPSRGKNKAHELCQSFLPPVGGLFPCYYAKGISYLCATVTDQNIGTVFFDKKDPQDVARSNVSGSWVSLFFFPIFLCSICLFFRIWCASKCPNDR